jgi:dihydrofolate synthase/folylpolyglutamate synthase
MAETPELASWLQHLESRHGRPVDLGLPRVRCVAQRLGLLPFPAPVLTVAGTNGKGTVTHCAAALAQAAGARVGAYTSPHLLRFNERIAIDGRPCNDRAIIGAFEAIEAARGDVSLSYFETATLAALWLFREARVDLAVLEVGLGGRLDAVNIVDADVAVITRIGLDHQGWLGSTVEAIAVEKAGIARRGRPVVLAEPAYPASLEAALRAVGARVLRQGRDWRWCRRASQLEVRGVRAGSCSLKVPAGLEASNVAAAICAVQLLLPLAAGQVEGALDGFFVPGRRQRMVCGRGELWLDVAHNEDAAVGLAAALPAGSRCHGLCAAMADKDLEAILRPLAPLLESLRVCSLPGNARAASAAALHAAARRAGIDNVERHADPAAAWQGLQSLLARGARGVVFGSFHTVGGIMATLPMATEETKGAHG